MRILFIGGTGNLSYDTSLRAMAEGHELYHLNRGNRTEKAIEGVHTLKADVADEAAMKAVIGSKTFDVVVDFIAYTREQVERDIRLFRGKTAQFVFISSASAYRKPAFYHVISESTPLHNPHWDYSRAKIACEQLLQAEWVENAFPMTIVRPSHTYSKGWIPTAWTSSDFTVAKRMLDGKEIIVHGDGQSLWTLTHTRDFAVGLMGLLGNPAALGEAVQITGDEALTWESVHQTIAAVLGVKPRIVHIPSDFIAAVDPDIGQHFLGDKAYSALFDCSKLKRLVPAFQTTISFQAGVRESIEWMRKDPSRQKLDARIDSIIDRVLAAWYRGMKAALD
ncbi:SDR family oxidoreductase [Treponema sp.]